MPVETVTITGEMYQPSGAPMAGAQITFALSPDVLSTVGTIGPQQIRTTADAAGAFSIALAPLAYSVRIRNNGGRVMPPVSVAIPDLDPVTWASLFGGITSHDWGLITAAADTETDWGGLTVPEAYDDWGTT